jgi:hypothetical protein
MDVDHQKVSEPTLPEQYFLAWKWRRYIIEFERELDRSDAVYIVKKCRLRFAGHVTSRPEHLAQNTTFIPIPKEFEVSRNIL